MGKLSADMSNVEKERVQLLDDDLVKPASKPMPTTSRKSVSKSSWFRCLLWALAILLMLFFFTLILFGTVSYFWTRHQVRRFTVVNTYKNGHDNPPFPATTLTEFSNAELLVKMDQAKLFWDQLRADMEPEHDLVISQNDLNGFLANSGDYLRGHVQVQITEGRFQVDMALPADRLPGGKDRIFVGSAHIETQDEGRSTNIDAHVTPQQAVDDLEFATLLQAQLLFMHTPPTEASPTVRLEYGQFLNWLVPNDWIAQQQNLWSCEWSMDCDHHRDHHHHQARKNYHHGEKDTKDCQIILETLNRIASVSIHDGEIVVKPKRALLGGWNNLRPVVEEPSATGVTLDAEQNNHGGGVRGRRHLSNDHQEWSMGQSLARRVLSSLFA
uniref:Uncharacterized protein n=1 Tax=Entomoneis paludosa TaxID=265537 RepID=A0A7S2VA41_9STRA|mmetsp:Transcript_10388/g.21354  ORF Transcript_10388/g.21354 Transcript_10388/m.21354 type:complete len:384 (+) Transcript_10388:19-1170(+)